MSEIWRVPGEWRGEECFILCGGLSVRDLDLSLLRGRRVIAINNSMHTYPDADYGIFTDKRWWKLHGERVRSGFRGRVVTITPMPLDPSYLLMERCRMSGLASDERHLALWHTTATAATNLAKHLGARVVNYLGLDGRDGPDGSTHHHEPHPAKWKTCANKYQYHREAMEHVARAMDYCGMRGYNANPRAAHRMFPHKPFEEMLAC